MNQLPRNNYYFKISGKELLFLLFLWILIYIEPITIGAFKISQLWKAIVVIGLVFYVIRHNLPKFIWIGILFALKYLVYSYMPYGYLRAVQDMLENLIFPMFLAFFYLKYKNCPYSTDKLINISLLLSLFMIFSAVPFLFGIESLNPVMELDEWGIEGAAMKGLFYSVAGSSKLFTIATIILVNFYGKFSNDFSNRLIWILAVLLGTYFVYTSWTRTGWFIFCSALILSLYYGANVKRTVTASLCCVLLFVALILLYNTNQAFKWRLTGGATYRQNTQLSFDQLAKARIPFIFVAINNIQEEGLGGQLIGYGTKRSIDLFKQKTGMAIWSHNRTFEIIESSGIVAIFLYLGFLYTFFSLVVRSLKHTTTQFKRVSIVSIFMFFGFYFSSHGTPFWGEIILAPIFISALIHHKKIHYKFQPNVRSAANG